MYVITNREKISNAKNEGPLPKWSKLFNFAKTIRLSFNLYVYSHPVVR